MKLTLKCTINGEPHMLTAHAMDRLIDVLREQLNLTGTKEGCGEGECGACAVILDGKLVNSCLVPFAQLDGAEIITIEGLAKTERFNIIQDAFIKSGAIQCGMCTPGMAVTAASLLDRATTTPESLTHDEIKAAFAGNLCRCTGYTKIFDALKSAAVVYKQQKGSE
ncbi:MAG: (2Fe-2S)-binding protein [Bdellovibrionota bacterium]|mgnify:CR=1 FL=1